MRVRPFLLRWSLFLGIILVLFTALALFFENKLVYPASKASDDWRDPADSTIRDVWFPSADGTSVHGWYLAHEGTAGAILFSHGNGGNITHRTELIRDLRRIFNRPVLIYDYPGYGKTEGQPSEAGCYAAGIAAFQWLVESQKIPAGKIILCGESLGGGVAIELGTTRDSEGLLLISTFMSLPKAAKAKFPFLPCEWFMANRYDSFKKIPSYRKPVFIAHGDLDDVIPFVQAERLFDLVNGPKRFHRRVGDKHNSAVKAEVLEDAKSFFAATITPAIP